MKKGRRRNERGGDGGRRGDKRGRKEREGEEKCHLRPRSLEGRGKGEEGTGALQSLFF